MAPPVDGDDLVGWLDVSAGVSGDMLLGALVDAGADLGRLQAAVDAVVPGTVRLRRREVTRAGMRATKVEVELLVPDQPHRSWADIRGLLASSGLAAVTKDRARRTFERLAEAEAQVHGVTPDAVHFHEVGAWDSVSDVVAVCAALEQLGVQKLTVGPVALGSGAVGTAHGQLPAPVPAVLALASGWDVHAGGRGELATPTGMALLTTLATGQGDLPRMTVTRHGLGAGSREVADRPNVVRLVLGRRSAAGAALAVGPPQQPQAPGADLSAREMVLLETNVDDLDPRVWPTVLDALLAAGAADAWLVPILMKKGRPAHTLSVLVPTTDAAVARDLVLDLTSTIGLRETPVRRWSLARGWVDVTVDTDALVAVKVAHRGGLVVHVTPEFADARVAAQRLGRPVREVLEAASTAAVAAGLRRGAAAPTALRDRPGR